ncbi:MAG: GGDEF domain-containing protein [Bdellovibrionales bacterium]|nr:GGDEF domain-containing protein [Bdellovibrionales bacterium]
MTESYEGNWASQASYSDLFFKLLDPAFLIDGESLKILEINDAAEKILGGSAEELREQSIERWIPEAERADFALQVRVTMRRYHPRLHEISIQCADGRTRLYRCDLCQLQTQDVNKHRSVLQIIAHDITAQREAEQNAQKYLSELQTALSDLKAANEKLESMSVTDEMTGIHNFRYLKQRLEIEHRRAIRFKRPYAILFLDVDHFKHYNDRNGHPAGDALLRGLAQLLKKSSRETDCVARYGGEEFVILAPETNEQQGSEFAERLRKIITSAGFENGEHQPLGCISVSIGVACYPESAPSAEDTLKAADEALYHSKKSGRNRVTRYSKPHPAES